MRSNLDRSPINSKIYILTRELTYKPDVELKRIKQEIEALEEEKSNKHSLNNAFQDNVVFATDDALKEVEKQVKNLARVKMRVKHPDALKRRAEIPGKLKDLELKIENLKQQIASQQQRDVQDEAEIAVLPENDFLDMSKKLREYWLLEGENNELGPQMAFWNQKILPHNLAIETQLTLAGLKKYLDATNNPEIRKVNLEAIQTLDDGFIRNIYDTRRQILEGQIKSLESRKKNTIGEMKKLTESLDGDDGTMGGSDKRLEALQEILSALGSLISERNLLQDELESSKTDDYEVFFAKIDHFFIPRISRLKFSVDWICDVMRRKSLETGDKPVSDREGTLFMREQLDELKRFLNQLYSIMEAAVLGAKDAIESRGTKDIQNLLHPFGFALPTSTDKTSDYDSQSD